MTKSIPVKSFTTTYNGISNVLENQAEVFPAFDPRKIKTKPLGKKYKAIWDTGATGTTITKRIVSELGLKPIGMTKVHTAGGEVNANLFLINISLSNKVVVVGVRVSAIEELSGGSDILIGMDIISNGDLAITNHAGKTVFSFRMPSMGTIDFTGRISNPGVIKERLKLQNKPKIHPNDPCPCGSGKKFKNCCRNKPR